MLLVASSVWKFQHVACLVNVQAGCTQILEFDEKILKNYLRSGKNRKIPWKCWTLACKIQQFVRLCILCNYCIMVLCRSYKIIKSRFESCVVSVPYVYVCWICVVKCCLSCCHSVVLSNVDCQHCGAVYQLWWYSREHRHCWGSEWGWGTVIGIW